MKVQGLSIGPHACQAGILPREPWPQPFFLAVVIFTIGSLIFPWALSQKVLLFIASCISGMTDTCHPSQLIWEWDVYLAFHPDWPQTTVLLIFTSWVTGDIGVPRQMKKGWAHVSCFVLFITHTRVYATGYIVMNSDSLPVSILIIESGSKNLMSIERFFFFLTRISENWFPKCSLHYEFWVMSSHF
jgi:hypothetical protein